MQKNIISFFCTIIFLQTRKNSHTTQLFYLSIYLFVLQLTSQKVIYSAYRKKKLFLSSFLNSFVFLSNSQEKNANLFISNYVYLKFSVFDKTNITLNKSTDF